MPSPFDVLRIDPDADEEEIEQAYRRRVKETHPDQGGSVGEFRAVRAAYEEVKSGPSGRLGGDHRAERGNAGEHHQAESRVEYLNYEVLDDYGWSIDDEDLFEKASAEGLAPPDHGRILVQSRESLLEAAENRGFTWPYACRGGACANCAVAVTEGELSLPVDHILPSEMVERDIRLSCVGAPTTGETQVVYNVKHLPDLDELRLPPHPFGRTYLDD